MQELNFDTGLVTFSINGKAEVTFNPTDSTFVERLFQTFDRLDGKQEDYKAKVTAAKGYRELFGVAREMDAEMREMIDTALGAPVCAQVFGDMSVYAIAGGLPVWSNLMLAVIEQIDTTFAQEQKKTNPRIQKYTGKYHK